MTLVEHLVSICGPQAVLDQEALLERYHHIWKMDQPLQAVAVVLPASTQEVAAILQLCNQLKQEVVVHGGLTNLVGGTETQPHQLVLSLERMNTIEEVDPISKTLTTQAGVIIENLIDAAAERDLMLPLNFGAKGSAQIGGALATNAGGLRVFRFGMTRQLVLGLEYVLPDGSIVSSLKKIIKDNSGYDLKQLLIGSEGTLGIITKVVLRLTQAPKTRSSALVGVENYTKVLDLLKHLDKRLGGTLSGFELMWQHTFETMTTPPSIHTAPLPKDYPYYVFVETMGNDPQNDFLRLETLITEALETDIILDGVLAQTQRELNTIWQIREDVSVLAAQAQDDQHFDISLPIPKIGSIIDSITQELRALAFVDRIFTFGHVADGNIHFIIGKKQNSPEIIKAINEVVYRQLKENNGSVSAEHGIGLHKKDYLNTSKSEVEIAIMKQLKALFDPHQILNPKRII
ncbi:MAG: FAD-binding oxidoreductase [Flavobacteriaceae bacterium]